MSDPSTFNCNSIVNKFTVCMKSVFIFGWDGTEEQMYLQIKSMESVKSRSIDKRKESVIDFYRLIDTIDISQIRWPIFIDLSTHKSIAIFIDWLLWALYGPVTVIRWIVSRFLLPECFTSGITTPFNQSCCIKLYFIYTWLKKLCR